MADPRNIIVWVLAGLLALVSVIAGRQVLARQAEEVAHHRTKAQHAEVLRDLAERTARAAGAALHVQQVQARAVADIDTQHTKELSHAIAENDRLRAAVGAGTLRLRVRAACPATPAGSDVPTTTPAAGLGDAGSAELDPAAGQDVLDLRAGIERAERALRAMQAYGRLLSHP